MSVGGHDISIGLPEESRHDGVLVAAVNLRGDLSVYLSNFEVETKQGAIMPIEREGHRYAFSHTLASGGYRAADTTAVGQQNLYVFVELEQ